MFVESDLPGRLNIATGGKVAGLQGNSWEIFPVWFGTANLGVSVMLQEIGLHRTFTLDVDGIACCKLVTAV